jgi:hypothetical protein
MQRETAPRRLTYDEAEQVAQDLARVWPGMTGSDIVPTHEALTDVVQRVQRKAREIIAERGEG